MSDSVTGTAHPIPRETQDPVAVMIREVSMVAADAIIKAKSMDNEHALRMAQALAQAKIDRNKRLERYAWAVLVIAALIVFFGREAVVTEISKAGGYIGSAVCGMIIGWLVKK